MISKKRASIITLISNYATNAFILAQSIILVPIYLHYFPLSVYGSWLATGNIIGILGMLEGGMNFVFSQKLSSLFSQKKYEEFTIVFTAGVIISALIFMILFVIGLIIYPFIPELSKVEIIYSDDIKLAFLISCLGAGIGIFKQNLAAVVASWLEVYVNGIVSFITNILGIITIIFALILNMGVVSIALGTFVNSLAGFVLLFGFIYYKNRTNKWELFDIKLYAIKSLSHDIFPMTFSTIGTTIVNQSQYLIIANFINPTSSAVFSITTKGYMAVSQFIAPLASSIFNSVAYFDKTRDLIKIKNVLKQILNINGIFSIALFGLVFAFNKQFVSLWVGHKSYGGDSLTILSFFSYFFTYRFNMISVFFLSLGQVKVTAFTNLIQVLIRLVVIFMLVFHLDFLAFPIALIISNIFAIIVYTYAIEKQLNINKYIILNNNLLAVIVTPIFSYFISNCIYDFENIIELVLYGSGYLLFLLFFLILIEKELRLMILNKIKLIVN